MTDPTRHRSPEPALHPTRDIAAWIAATGKADIDAGALAWARHCLLDWLAVTVPGAREDLVGKLTEEALADEATGRFPVVGRDQALTASWSVLINGAASHALDFDDVNTAMHGHPTVAVLPAVLIAGAATDRLLEDVLAAFVVGYETACLVGEMTGDAHYDKGWHATATVGTFGAAAGVAWLEGQDAERTAHALGTAATMAAGLKSMFGPMCKPLHAGRAAQSGYLAARMAGRGWVARDDALECAQGFWDTQGPDHAPFPVARQYNRPFQIENNLFKYHAACYMTHSAIEAAARLRADHALTPEKIARVRLKVAAGHLRVCNIPEPATGLEIKFSLRHTAAMALAGIDTAAIANYSDAVANDPALVALRRKVEVEPITIDRSMETQADVIVETTDGTSLMQTVDVGVPATDLDAQEARLVAKFHTLVEPLLGAEKTGALRSMALSGTSGPMELLRAAR